MRAFIHKYIHIDIWIEGIREHESKRVTERKKERARACARKREKSTEKAREREKQQDKENKRDLKKVRQHTISALAIERAHARARTRERESKRARAREREGERERERERECERDIRKVLDDSISALGIEVLILGGGSVGDDALHARALCSAQTYQRILDHHTVFWRHTHLLRCHLLPPPTYGCAGVSAYPTTFLWMHVLGCLWMGECLGM